MSKRETSKPTVTNDAKTATPRHSGPDRRGRHDPADDVAVDIRFDAKGNPVWEMRTTVPRRRQDDDTFDLLKVLDVDSLSIAEESQAGPTDEGNAGTPKTGYDPYDRATKK